jgi:predicted dehydrogenase
MIRAGFIGCGGIAREYLNRLEGLGDTISVTAFCDIEEKRAGELAAGLGARTYTDYRRMFDAEQLDAVFDNLPPFARENELVLAAEHGCAIFTTKPLGLNLETPQRSLEAIERAGVINSVGYMFRYSGITQYAKFLVADRPVAMVLGRVLGAMPGGWNSKRALSGGQLVEQSTHIFDLARYFLGDVRSVYALGRTGYVPDRVDYEDVTTVALDFTDGGVGSVVSTCAVWKFFWGFTVVARDLHLELVFDEWTVRGSVDGRQVDYRDEMTGYQEQITTFVRAVQTQDQSLVRCAYRDGMGTLATTLAANKSLESGKPEAVEK